MFVKQKLTNYNISFRYTILIFLFTNVMRAFVWFFIRKYVNQTSIIYYAHLTDGNKNVPNTLYSDLKSNFLCSNLCSCTLITVGFINVM